MIDQFHQAYLGIFRKYETLPDPRDGHAASQCEPLQDLSPDNQAFHPSPSVKEADVVTQFLR